MKLPAVASALFACALLSSALTALADQPEAPDAAASQVEEEPLDPVEYVRLLRRSLRHYETPAPRTERVTALRDAWTAILRPRARRMTARLESWERPDRWMRPDDGGPPTGLAPDQWPSFTRDVAALAAELQGAWTQYGSVALRGKQTAHGMAVLPRPPRLDSGYGFPTVDGRLAACADEGVADAGPTYPVLLGWYRSRWLRRLEVRREYFQWWRRQEAAHRRTYADLESELAHTRSSLAEDLVGLKTLVAALQHAEEQRLEAVLEPLPKGMPHAEARLAIRALAGTRIAAETSDARTSSKYGALLRDWLRERKAALGALAKVAPK